MSNFIIIEKKPQRCEGCGLIAETRPFGLNYEQICIDCALEDEALSGFRMKELNLGIFE